MLGPSLGTSMSVWEPHLPTLLGFCRVLRFDLPGHGGSPAGLLKNSSPGRTTVAELAQLVLDVVDSHFQQRFHYAGISLGGAIGAQLALQHPERVASLAMVCSSAHFGASGPWHERAALVRREGTRALLAATPSRWFADPEGAESPLGKALLSDLMAADPAGYAACCDALATYDIRDDLKGITAPTLVLSGTHDRPTPLLHAVEIAEAIRGSHLKVISTGHLAFEDPEAVGVALTDQLSAVVHAALPS
ncbi:alpha/beta fold hydrolase [Streptomyces sp. NPDC055815]